jgi:hypothetical protein
VSASFELKLEREREIFSILCGLALHVLGSEEKALGPRPNALEVRYLEHLSYRWIRAASKRIRSTYVETHCFDNFRLLEVYNWRLPW